MTNIETVDYALAQTYDRTYEYYRGNSEMIFENITHSLKQILLDNNYSGITRNNQARDYLQEISAVEVKAELLKYLVGMVSYKRAIKDPSIEKGTAIADLNDVIETTRVPYVENGLYNLIEEFHINPQLRTEYNLEQGQIGFDCLENEVILDHVLRSFISNRYQNHLVDEINQFVMENPMLQEINDEIDMYGMRLENIYEGQSR